MTLVVVLSEPKWRAFMMNSRPSDAEKVVFGKMDQFGSMRVRNETRQVSTYKTRKVFHENYRIENSEEWLSATT
jgi:hypothetical protein